MSTSACGGLSALKVVQAANVRLENSRIAGFNQAAVLVEPTSGSTAVTLDGVDIRSGCAQGVKVSKGTSTVAAVTINNTTIAGSQGVSTSGSDVNPCSRTAPCRTFAGAIGKTAALGEINVLGNGNYGTVLITKPITIDGTGATAAVNVPAGGAGIIVNTAANHDVILRNLMINSDYSVGFACPYRSAYGVQVLGGRVVTIENVSVGGS